MRKQALALAVLLLGTTVVVLTDAGRGYSDGVAGASGAIEEHLQRCQGVQYCKVIPPGCGGCHGERDAMAAQRGTEPPVIDRIELEIKLNGDPDLREYEPGKVYVVDLRILADRANGRYNSGGFNLNVSGGRLQNYDDTVRVTGGVFHHAGTKNESVPTEGGQKYGAGDDDESEWAGEATHTAKGAERRSWRIKWTAPDRAAPHGVAFQVAHMVPDGNGWNNGCVHNRNETGACDASRGYSDQDGWDWWYFGIPLRIVCEKGQDPDECRKAVLADIRPPPPPLDLCPESEETCAPTSAADGGDGTPGPHALSLAPVAALALWLVRRRL